ncbi:uncharacterized protein LOC131687053 [Topomyia yanbarensis]|uniref:uncharacterized protein LOC131687053 n=1 Tax=Topomyia yanbarensis TaxID=2498891 RepID=UPI00273BF60E|nr:uncharacterized protein LOC131687053 [Topomyia yanbarensis]
MEPVQCNESNQSTATSVRDIQDANKTDAEQISTGCEMLLAKFNDLNLAQSSAEYYSLADRNASTLRSFGNTLGQARIFRAPIGNEYIKKKKPTAGKINELRFSARFTLQSMDIKLHSEGCLLLVNNDFMAKISIQQPGLLEDTRDFEHAKQVLLEQIRVVEVYYNDLLIERNRLRDEFLQTLENVGSNSATYCEFALDCMELNRLVELEIFEKGLPYLSGYRVVCEEIVKRQLFSGQVTKIAAELYDAECALSRRSELLPSIGALFNTNSSEFVETLQQFHSTAVDGHRKYLLRAAPACLLLHHFQNLPSARILLISGSDVELFANLTTILRYDIFQKPLKKLANRFIDKVNAMKICQFPRKSSLTNPIFILLCKFLQEVIIEFSGKINVKPSELIKYDATGWKSGYDVRNLEDNLTKCLQREYHFVLKLLNHFEPGSIISSKPFEYEPRLLVNESIQNCQTVQESFIWYCLLDDALSAIASRNELADYGKILQVYTTLIQEANREQLEIVPVVNHSLVHFIAGTIGIFEHEEEVELVINRQILQKQALGNRLPGLNCQLDYDSFEHFVTSKTEPVSSAVNNSKSVDDMKRRIGYKIYRLNSNWMQCEMDLDMTLANCAELNGFCEEQKAFQQYLDQYQQYMSLAEDVRIDRIVETLKTTTKPLHFKPWDQQFKQDQLPKILAGIAALWFTLAYEKDSKAGVFGTIFSNTKKSSKENLCGVRKWTAMPSVFDCSMLRFDKIDNVCRLLEHTAWMNCILDKARAVLESHRSVIIVFERPKQLIEFQTDHGKHFDRLNALSDDTPDVEKQRIIQEAGVPGTVTLLTFETVPGVDYNSSQAVEKAGGIHVIQTFLSWGLKRENQIKGLTARNGNGGSYEMIAWEANEVSYSSIEEHRKIYAQYHKNVGFLTHMIMSAGGRDFLRTTID